MTHHNVSALCFWGSESHSLSLLTVNKLDSHPQLNDGDTSDSEENKHDQNTFHNMLSLRP